MERSSGDEDAVDDAIDLGGDGVVGISHRSKSLRLLLFLDISFPLGDNNILLARCAAIFASLEACCARHLASLLW